MAKSKIKKRKKTNWLARIFRFFIPKDFHASLYEGMRIGEELKRGRITPKILPTWWLGKGLRKIIDPKHKLQVGKEKKGDKDENKRASSR